MAAVRPSQPSQCTLARKSEWTFSLDVSTASFPGGDTGLASQLGGPEDLEKLRNKVGKLEGPVKPGEAR